MQKGIQSIVYIIIVLVLLDLCVDLSCGMLIDIRMLHYFWIQHLINFIVLLKKQFRRIQTVGSINKLSIAC